MKVSNEKLIMEALLTLLAQNVLISKSAQRETNDSEISALFDESIEFSSDMADRMHAALNN